MIRTTNNLVAGQTVSSVDNFFYPLESNRSSGVVIGDYKSITSPMSPGRFVPGRYRVNPVVIRTCHGFAEPGSLSCTTMQYSRELTMHCDGYWYLGVPYTFDTSVLMDAPSWEDALASERLVRAYARMNAADVEVGVMLGEILETIELLRHPFRSLAKYLKLYRKARKPKVKGKRLVSMTASELLEVQYGVLPLANDIAAIMAKVLATTGRISSSLRRQSSSHTLVVPGHTVFNGMAGLTQLGEWTMGRISVRRSSTTTCHSTVYYQHLLHMEAMTMAKEWGLTPDLILATEWALVPFSFVVDWFVDVSSWLRAISPSHTLNILGNSTSLKTVEDCTVECLGRPTFFGVPCTMTGGTKFLWHSETLERRVNSTLPVMPVWTGSWLDFQKSVNSLAMLWQKVGHYL